MTIKTSGKLSLKEIAQELGVLASSTLGYMVSRATNIYSPKQVNKTPPHKISEFYGYNHNAVPSSKTTVIGMSVTSSAFSPVVRKLTLTCTLSTTNGQNALGKKIRVDSYLRNGSKTGSILDTDYREYTVNTTSNKFTIADERHFEDSSFPSFASSRLVYWEIKVYSKEDTVQKNVAYRSCSYGGPQPDTTTTTTS